MRLFIVICLCLGLSACAPRYHFEVTRFVQDLPTKGTLVVMPKDPQKNGSLEFQSVANMAGVVLQASGFEVTSQNPQLIALLDYGVHAPTLDFEAVHRSNYVSIGDSLVDLGGTRYEPRIRQQKFITIDIVDAKAYLNQGLIIKFCESSVLTSNFDGDLLLAVKWMVKALGQASLRIPGKEHLVLEDKQEQR